MKNTGRKERRHTPNTIHHVMVRGNNRQRVFYGEEYFTQLLQFIVDSTKKFDYKILAYCLMTNHMHFIICVHESPLSQIMQNINYRYARWINKKQNRIGHLFQGRYRSIEVNDETYLINLCRYIHLNPIAANIVTELGDYPWSSHNNYAASSAPEWLDINTVCIAIQNKTSLNYRDFMRQPPEREKWKSAFYLSETGDIMIDHDVVRNINKENIHKPMRKKILTTDDVGVIVCNCLKISSEELYSQSRNRKTCAFRILLAHCCIKYAAMTLSEMAIKLQRTTGTLSRQLNQFINFPQEYNFSSDVMQQIENELKQAINLQLIIQ